MLLPAAAWAADLAGASDPTFLKRFEGSEIIYSYTRNFDDYALIVPNPAKAGTTKTENHEGAVTRLLYRVPAGHTALELLRNYEGAVRDAGLSIAYEFTPCAVQTTRDFPDQLFKAVQDPGLTTTPLMTRAGSYVFASSVGSFCALTAHGSVNGQDIGLSVAIVEEADPNPDNRMIMTAKPIAMALGETLVMVDVVSAKSLQTHMVLVKAADMADALATKGSIDLYGIYFDTDKTDVKPDSTATLDEIANLLRIDRSLKLEVSGHTDNTGAKDHNMKLSLGRAQAVVNVLVTKYHIDAKRLVAKGYGDTRPVAPNDSDANKAKNRRVELKRI
jgi:outer membrane protein OmpA-like peptidoglycan-associated protein